jgi:hypothetical protein
LAEPESRARTVFYHDYVADIEQLAARLEPFDVVVLKIKC